ncbi:hypothetical protein B879_04242 [Cecembia lonarensis LW9]|uniref:Uncharacterized protein n=1 Tax=Cecembia lonarensis (strain CCUG 58316 / KCTC 22772 / LW9) TaxID=1225176 RepID=K1KSM6_CECL9|nr:hypothetical protein B879_04242 [Cecembia lonarensis LW9]
MSPRASPTHLGTRQRRDRDREEARTRRGAGHRRTRRSAVSGHHSGRDPLHRGRQLNPQLPGRRRQGRTDRGHHPGTEPGGRCRAETGSDHRLTAACRQALPAAVADRPDGLLHPPGLPVEGKLPSGRSSVGRGNQGRRGPERLSGQGHSIGQRCDRRSEDLTVAFHAGEDPPLRQRLADRGDPQ